MPIEDIQLITNQRFEMFFNTVESAGVRPAEIAKTYLAEILENGRMKERAFDTQ